jgi:hypothetical protein
VTVREATIPTDPLGLLPLRILECGQMWTGYGMVGDRWVVVQSLGVSLDGLRLEQVSDPSSVPDDLRG